MAYLKIGLIAGEDFEFFALHVWSKWGACGVCLEGQQREPGACGVSLEVLSVGESVRAHVEGQEEDGQGCSVLRGGSEEG